jgi:hypothetical protein
VNTGVTFPNPYHVFFPFLLYFLSRFLTFLVRYNYCVPLKNSNLCIDLQVGNAYFLALNIVITVWHTFGEGNELCAVSTCKCKVMESIFTKEKRDKLESQVSSRLYYVTEGEGDGEKNPKP